MLALAPVRLVLVSVMVPVVRDGARTRSRDAEAPVCNVGSNTARSSASYVSRMEGVSRSTLSAGLFSSARRMASPTVVSSAPSDGAAVSVAEVEDRDSEGRSVDPADCRSEPGSAAPMYGVVEASQPGDAHEAATRQSALTPSTFANDFQAFRSDMGSPFNYACKHKGPGV